MTKNKKNVLFSVYKRNKISILKKEMSSNQQGKQNLKDVNVQKDSTLEKTKEIPKDINVVEGKEFSKDKPLEGKEFSKDKPLEGKELKGTMDRSKDTKEHSDIIPGMKDQIKGQPEVLPKEQIKGTEFSGTKDHSKNQQYSGKN